MGEIEICNVRISNPFSSIHLSNALRRIILAIFRNLSSENGYREPKFSKHLNPCRSKILILLASPSHDILVSMDSQFLIALQSPASLSRSHALLSETHTHREDLIGNFRIPIQKKVFFQKAGSERVLGGLKDDRFL
jgi:hypothetical protein